MAHRMAQDQSVKHLGDPSHSSHLSSGLNQLRHHAAFCDVTVVVGDQKFPAHKAVLSCASDYFQRMFSSGFQEKTMSEITVTGTEESFAQILDFAYTGYFNVSVHTIVGILKMACYMLFNGAVELCAQYLKGVKDELTIEDCFEIWTVASTHCSLSRVAQMYRSHLILNFMKCVKSQVFLENCSASMMIEILSSEEIENDIITEEEILQGAVMWLENDWEQRKVHAVDLLKKIRVGLVPMDRLCPIDKLVGIPGCKKLVDEVAKLRTSKDTTSMPLFRSHPLQFATRNTITAGLYTKDKMGSVISLACSHETGCYKLTKLADVPNQPRMLQPDYFYYQESGIGLLVTNAGLLYAGGGKRTMLKYYYGNAESYRTWYSENNFFRFDCEKNEWIVLPPMPILLFSPRLFEIDEYIYAIGENASRPVTMVERYNTLSQVWETVVDGMHVLPEQTEIIHGHILIKGSNPDDSLYKVALFTPVKNQWLDVSIDTTLDEHSYFLEHNNMCYLVTKGKQQDKVNRCVCEFDSDRPTIVIAETVEDEAINAKLSRSGSGVLLN